MSDKDKKYGGAERRQYKRVNRNFIMTYFDLSNPSERFEITQLKNISKGGMCFITTKEYHASAKLGIDLKTPYLTDATYLEGVVLQSHEKVKDLIYETRLKFELVDAQAEFVLAKVVDYFLNEENGDAQNHE